MDQNQLSRLRERVVHMAHMVWLEGQQHADSELISRAWDRLVDSAYALEAMYARRKKPSSGARPDDPSVQLPG